MCCQLGCDRLTSRVYDIACLTELHISHNRYPSPQHLLCIACFSKAFLYHASVLTFPSYHSPLLLSSRLLRLSPDVADLSKLTVLDVSHNYIRTLPVEIKNMAALTTLNVGMCLITHHNPRHIISRS